MKSKYIIILFLLFIYSCATSANKQNKINKEKIYYSSSGFALIYDNHLFDEKIITKKLDSSIISVSHRALKKNTLIKIINPVNSKFIITKISKKSNFPKIFNIAITQKTADILELQVNEPYVEIVELKKNKTFIAKKSNIFEEEKNVADKAPVEEISMNEITTSETSLEKSTSDKKNYILVISDFYYIDSAMNLKNSLIKKTYLKNISIKRIADNKYRLLAGPFKNFNALKKTYISLNNLGFEDLNIYTK